MRQIGIVHPLDWLSLNDFMCLKGTRYANPRFHTHICGEAVPFSLGFQFHRLCTFHPGYCRTHYITAPSGTGFCSLSPVAKSILRPPSNLNLRIPQFPPAPKIFLCFGSFYSYLAPPHSRTLFRYARASRSAIPIPHPILIPSLRFGSTKAKRDCGTQLFCRSQGESILTNFPNA